MTELSKPVRVFFLVLLGALAVGVISLHSRNVAAEQASAGGTP